MNVGDEKWQRREACPHCGAQLRRSSALPMPAMGNYLDHQVECPLLCDHPGCFITTPTDIATCDDHHPLRLAEIARLEAEQERRAVDRKARYQKRQRRAATGPARRELKAAYNRPLTIHEVLGLSVRQFKALEMVADDMSRLG